MVRSDATARTVTADSERELVLRFLPRVRLYLCRHLAEVHLADDLAHDVLLTLIQALRRGEVRHGEHLGAFVAGICRNKVREKVRERVTRQAALARLAQLEDAVAGPIPRTRIARLEECLGMLTERDRQILRLTFADGQTAPETARALKISAENVRVRRHRTIARLRKCVGVQRLEVQR